MTARHDDDGAQRTGAGFPDTADDRVTGEEIDGGLPEGPEATDEALDDEHDPEDVPEVNAWLTIIMFALFVATTVGCYLWLDGWH